MSHSTRQSLTLLAAIGGCLIRLDTIKAFEKSPIIEFVTNETAGYVHEALKNWPQSGDTRKNQRWVAIQIETWRLAMKEDDVFYPEVLAKVCEQCAADLLTVINNSYKLKLLKPVAEGVAVIHGHFDSAGENFEAYEETERLMRKLYELIDWSW